MADVVLTRRDLDAALRSALHAEFTEAEIAELTLTVAMAVGFSKSAIAWGPEPQLPDHADPHPGLVTWQPPPRPRWVARLNAHETALGGASLVSLDRDELQHTARVGTGHDDFGDSDGWRDHFDVFMAALDDEADLHAVGRLMTRTDLLRALETRLELTAAWNERPELLTEPVREPVFVVGAARSGTSILHELLGLDTRHRALLTWEANQPDAAASGDPARRTAARRTADAIVSFWHDVQPEYETMHHNGGELPTECIFLTVPYFLSDNWAGTHTVPSYGFHVATADHTPAYRWHRRILQTLQHGDPRERWILKAPSHLPTLRQLFSVYPDARVVAIHRDPARTLPSMFNLMATLQWMRSDRVDPMPAVDLTVDGLAHLQHRTIVDRADGTLPDERFVDLRYADLMADPAAAVSSIYSAFGWDEPDTSAENIHSYLARKPRGAKGSHDYSLATFGLDADDVRRRYAGYLERFSIDPEP